MNEQSHSLLPAAANEERRVSPNSAAPVAEVVKIVEKKRSKRWILTLVLLCLLLTTALVACYIKYKQCCSSTCSQTGQSSGQNGGGGDKQLRRDEYDQADNKPAHLAVHHTNWNNSRLPSNLVPYYYTINLRIDVHEKKFNGSCTIFFKCVYSTNIIVVHAETNLDIKPVPVVHELESERSRVRRRSLEIKSMVYNPVFSYYVIQLKNNYFVEGRHYSILFSDFSSSIVDNLKGLYLSSYTMENQTR